MGTARAGIVVSSLLVATAMGVRTPRVKTFVTGTHAGVGRVELGVWPSNHGNDTSSSGGFDDSGNPR
jgi:hypothetical protein